jgi:cation:H+ antiporter
MIIPLFLLLLSAFLLYSGASVLTSVGQALPGNNGKTTYEPGFRLLLIGINLPGVLLTVLAPFWNGGMAAGNIIGSQIFILCVLPGVAAMISTQQSSNRLKNIVIPILIAFSLLFMVFFDDRNLSRTESAAMLTGILVYFIIRIKRKKNMSVPEETEKPAPAENQEEKQSSQRMRIISAFLQLISGTAALMYGALQLTEHMDLGKTFAGLTLIAIGTGLPRLVPVVKAAARKETENALQLIIGSALINLVLVTAFAGIVHPFTAIAISNFDLYALLGASLSLLPWLKRNYLMKRDEGAFLIAMYLIYLYYLLPK